MSKSAQFEKISLELFSKHILSENKIRSVYGGAETETTSKAGPVPVDTVDENGCTSFIYHPDIPAQCDGACESDEN